MFCFYFQGEYWSVILFSFYLFCVGDNECMCLQLHAPMCLYLEARGGCLKPSATTFCLIP